MLVVDPRLDQVQKVVESLVTKTLLDSTYVLVTSDNNLILVVDDTLLYMIPLTNETCYPALGFSYARFLEMVANRTVDFSVEAVDIYDAMITIKLTNLYTGYCGFLSNDRLIAYNEDLKNAESFAEYLTIKADDGMRYYSLPAINHSTNYHIPIFAGFPNISSQDKLGVYVYSIDERFLLAKFSIFKKKINRNIDILFRIINLNWRQ